MAADGRPRRGRLAPVLLALAALPLALLWPALLGDRALVGLHTGALSPWRAALSPELARAAEHDSILLAADKTIQFQPLLAASLERLTRGEVPLWNPLNLAGVPLLAQAFQGAFYPPAWLATVISWPRAFGWIAWLQAALAGVFAALLLSELGVGRRAALLAGSTYMLCGYLSARWHWYQIQGCSMVLPLALWGIERLFRPELSGRRRARLVALLASTLAVALALLSGWLQGAVHLIYVGALWTLVRAVGGLRAGGGRATLAASGRCLGALTLGLALALPQLGPTLEYVASGASARSQESPEVVRSVAMDPLRLAALLAPDIFGHPSDLARHELVALRTRGALALALLDPDDNDNFVESASTLGLVALALAVLGAATARPGRWLALTLALAGLALALDSPLLLLVARLPGLASGDPQRFLLLAAMGGTILAAFGLQRLIDQGPPPWWRRLLLAAALSGVALACWSWTLTPAGFTAWLADGLARATGVTPQDVLAYETDLTLDLELLRQALTRLAAVAALAWLAVTLSRRQRALGLAALLTLAVGDQALTGWRNAQTVPLQGLFGAPPGLDRLLDADGGRLVRYSAAGVEAPLEAPLPPNTGLPFGISDLGGYWALAPRRMIELFEGLAPGSTGGGLGQVAFADAALLRHPALDLLAVTRVLSTEPLSLPGLQPLGALGDAWLYARPGARPRAWFTTARSVDGPEQSLASLLDPLADPAGPAPLEPLAGRRAPDQPPLVGAAPAVRFSADLPEHIELLLDAPQAGVVVLADTWMPGWSATLDGQGTDLWPAWHALRAVVVPAGRHRVTMRYDSPAFRLGLYASAAALLLLAWLSWRALRPAHH